MTRLLATIRTLSELRPIPDADRIETAQIGGWQCVVKKGEFQVGDKGVYFEIDSLLPETPDFEFMRDRKFRVRTIKLRGQLSQGLFMPLSVLPPNKQPITGWRVGDDVTDLLGVHKYDPEGEAEAKLAAEQEARQKNKIQRFLMHNKWYRRLYRLLVGKREKGWPRFIAHTDEERVQNLGPIISANAGILCSYTEKANGTSATYFLVRNKRRFLWRGTKHTFGVCSRNVYLKSPRDKTYYDENHYWKIAKMFNVEQVLEKLIGDNQYVVLQGEILGPGIQGNCYQLKDLDFYGFNLIYPQGRIPTEIAAEIVGKHGIKWVPILKKGWALPGKIDDILEEAKGISVLNPAIPREGIVIRNSEKNISFKAINNDYLLKYKD